MDTDKDVAVVVRRPPLGSLKGTEALRMALGQSTTNRVTLILVEVGVWLAASLKPDVVEGGEIGKHLDMLLRLKQRVWVEAESLDRFGLGALALGAGIQVVSRQEIDRELLAADAVVVF